MNPLMLKILLHYYYCIDPYAGGENPEMVRNHCQLFCQQGLLKTTQTDYAQGPALRIYIEAVLAVPCPVQRWFIPVVPTKVQ